MRTESHLGPNWIQTLVAAVLLLLVAVCPTVAEGEEGEETGPANFLEAIENGKVTLALNYRYETVDQANFDKDAGASTLRTALGYRMTPYKHFSFFLEFQDVRDIGTLDRYNNIGAGDLNNGVRDRPVIADPKNTDLNQGHISFHFKGDSKVDLGRREIILDNHRFVGNVGWRQNHQSFDALTFTTQALKNMTLTYAFIENVNRINGGNHRMGSHILNLNYQLGPGKLIGYGYLLDYDNEAQFGLSTATYGLRFAGAKPFEKTKLRYEVEWATQSDNGDNPNEISADYYLIQIGGNVMGLNFDVAREVLGGSEKDGAFATPLATLHKWNGWADKFLRTPTQGLQDTFFSAGWAGNGFNLKAVYHIFESDSESIDYGDEVDLLLTYKTKWKQVFAVKAGFYGADEFSVDTDKIWFWTSYKF